MIKDLANYISEELKKEDPPQGFALFIFDKKMGAINCVSNIDHDTLIELVKYWAESANKEPNN